MAKDCRGGRDPLFDEGWCAGLFIVRNTPLSLKFMQVLTDEWLYKCFMLFKQRKVAVFMEQSAMAALNHIGEFSGIITEIPAHGFHGQLTGNNDNTWYPGYFCLHLAGLKGGGKRKAICKKLGMDFDTGLFPEMGWEI